MINAIVFSKDRACQLELLLNSIKLNADNIFNIKVIYIFSGEEFKQGYEKLSVLYPEVKWIRQIGNFKNDVLIALNSDVTKYSCFFTDDDIIYKSISETDLVEKMESDQEAICFSLRLGKNVDICYTANQTNQVNVTFSDEKFMQWNWKHNRFDFGYPLSVDGHIFRTSEIAKMTKAINFSNPNTYEANLQTFNSFPKENMWAYTHSVLVNSPANVVQIVFNNRNGEQFGFTTKELNDLFLSGKKISIADMDFKNIRGCHQELQYKFT